MLHSQGKNEMLCISKVTAPGNNMPFLVVKWEHGGSNRNNFGSHNNQNSNHCILDSVSGTGYPTEQYISPWLCVYTHSYHLCPFGFCWCMCCVCQGSIRIPDQISPQSHHLLTSRLLLFNVHVYIYLLPEPIVCIIWNKKFNYPHLPDHFPKQWLGEIIP